MSNRIYQAYYKPEQKQWLDPEFYHYDNTSNPVNNLYEHYLYHRIREISIQDGIEKWGLHKRIALNIVAMTGTSGNKILLGFILLLDLN